MSIQKMLQSSFLNKHKKEKEITLSDGKTVTIKSGDLLYVRLKNEEEGIFKATFVDTVENNDLWVYVLNNNQEFIDLKVSEDRVYKVERSN